MNTHPTPAVDGDLRSLDGLGHRARDRVLDGAQAMRDNARQARSVTTRYIRHRPLPAVLIAAGAGMAIVLLAGLLAQTLRRRA